MKDSKPKLGFLVPASNGYRVYVSGDSPKRVSLFVFRTDGSGSLESAYYSTNGTVTRRKIRASFGSLGQVAMRFKPTGGTKRGKVDCEFRRRWVAVRGRFRGTFDFHGEGGYAAASTERAISRATPVPPQPCSVFGKTRWATVLSAYTSGKSTIFLAYKPKRGSSVLLVGALNQRTDGIRIVRYIQALAPPSVFSLSPQWDADISSPPFPFSGTAHLRDYVSPPAPSKGKWTGSLAGTFTGLGEASLAGPDFNVGVVNTSPIY